MKNLEAYKKQIRESIINGMSDFGMREKLDPHVDELAGSIIAAGPQKVADAISKMDPATFTEFAKKIDAKGILMITKQFAAGTTATPTTPDAGAVAGTAPAGSEPEAAAIAPPVDQELKDL